MSDIIKIKDEYLNKLKEISDVKEINQLKSELFGKSGKISNEFKKMGSLNSEERKKTSSELNDAKSELQNLIEKKLKDIEIIEINSKLKNERVDVTLPGRSFNRGKFILYLKLLMKFHPSFHKLVFLWRKDQMLKMNIITLQP